MAVPLISASFIQMAYSMTDMLWLGHLGSDAVAAAGEHHCTGEYCGCRRCSFLHFY